MNHTDVAQKLTALEAQLARLTAQLGAAIELLEQQEEQVSELIETLREVLYRG